jgi:hypothetical protein
VAYAALWCAFVAAALAVKPLYGDAVPTAVIQTAVWITFMIFLGVQAIATLVQYRMGRLSGR